jgi:hypothetical protein
MAAVRRWTRFRTPGIALYSAITVVALAQTLTACQVNMIAARVSTVQTLTPARSAVVIQGARAEVVQRLQAELSGHGAALIDRANAPNGATLYVFRGQRMSATIVRGNSYGVYGSSYQIGSSYFARLRDVPGGVEVFLMGKPTVNGTDLCSDADTLLAEFDYHCSDSRLREDSSLWAQVSGREETEAVRGVIVRLSEGTPAAASVDAAPPNAAPPSAPPAGGVSL